MKTTKKISVILAACTIALLLCAPVSAFDEFTMPKTNTPPAIDGKLDDCYFKLHDFYDTEEFLDDRDFDKEGKGAAYVTWDDTNLYVYIEAIHDSYEPSNTPKVAADGSCMYLAILSGLPDDFNEDSQIQLAINFSEDGTQEFKYTGSVPEDDRYDSVENVSPVKLFDYITVRDDAKKITYYEVALPWSQLDRTGTIKFVEGHKFTFNYIVVLDPPIIVQYGQGLMNDIYDGGGFVTLGPAPAVPEPEPEPEPAVEQPAASAPAEPAPAPQPEQPVTVPQTGDNLVLYAVVLAAAAAFAVAKKRKTMI
ncbi:MAG: hypothetical protein FWD23_07720 [Oscillospiraceae bacterium]|nr:hypothetical protein [Oscillospiraceae bacterium]